MPYNFQHAITGIKQLGNLGMVVGVIVAISFLFPTNIKFKYEFQKGQIWKYEDLVSPFDFAIQKSQQQLTADREAVVREFQPYYQLDEALAAAKIQDFQADLQQSAPALKAAADSLNIVFDLASSLQFGKATLAELYERGIIELAPEHRNKTASFVIQVVKGNTSFKRTVPSFHTLASAKQALDKAIAQRPAPFPPRFRSLLSDALTANIEFDDQRTQRMRQAALSAVAGSEGIVSQGDLIVGKGNVVTDDVYEKLASFRTKFETDIRAQKDSKAVYFGYLLLTSLVIGAFMMYVGTYRKEILSNWRYLAFVMMWLLIFSYLTYLVERTQTFDVYAVPYCIVPIVVRHFFTYRLAFFTHVVLVLITGLLTSESYQFTFTQVVAGVVAVLSVADARDWTKFFSSVLFILGSYLFSHIGLTLIAEGNLRELDPTVLGWLALNGMFSLLAFPLIPLAERLFGFTSAISLVELSDMNRPLLRELAMKAPGTFQHSLQVGNLAEAAANEIGADALLVRVGALYHDIGKTTNPEFFVENQTGSSPHATKTAVESAQIIIGHVQDGEKLAKKYRLPKVLIRFINTHHGTTRVEYFYKTYLQEHPGEEVDPALFTYPGPLPLSKEEAILMLADSVEATSRSLKDPTGQDIDKLVDKIFASKVEQGQLHDSKLNFGDLEKCRQVFRKMLRSIHHVRIEYPA